MKQDLEIELHVGLTNAITLARGMKLERERMRTMLLNAAEQFASYADHHLAKDPPDQDKAKTNVRWAADCRQAAGEP
jgi:hypothetical protein